MPDYDRSILMISLYVSVGYALLLAQYLGLAARFTPAVAAYWQRLLPSSA